MSKFALLFSGQGSQYIGMGKQLAQRYSVAKRVFEEASEVLSFDIGRLCFDGNMVELTRTENTQPAILTMSVAAFQAYMEEIGVLPHYWAGHSLGEISALTCAGTIPFADAVRIAQSRGRIMTQTIGLSPVGMAAVVGVGQEIIEESCRRASKGDLKVVLSNVNSPSQIVISGHKQAVESAGEMLKKAGAYVTNLNVSAPFHSPLMQPAALHFAQELTRYDFRTGLLKAKVLSNVTARPHASKEHIPNLLTKQIVSPVEWRACMAYLQEQDVSYALEIGPGNTLRKLVVKNSPHMKAHSFDKDEIGAIKLAVQPFKRTVKDKLSFLRRTLGIAISTQNFNYNNEEYLKGVVEPYKKIQQLMEQLEAEGAEPTEEQLKAAIEMLHFIFVTKKTPKNVQRERFQQLFRETNTEYEFENIVT